VSATVPHPPPDASTREPLGATPAPGVASLAPPGPARTALAERIDALLPQTQCTRCGYPDCRAYADALAADAVPLNRCPPGGAEGVRRLAGLLGRPALALDPAHGHEGPRRVVFIAEASCIGCTLCIQACPVDAIIGAPKRMHTIIEQDCTGCELCLPVCPVDCMVLEDARAGAPGGAAWAPAPGEGGRARPARRPARVPRDAREEAERLAASSAARQASVARQARGTPAPAPMPPAAHPDDVARSAASARQSAAVVSPRPAQDAASVDPKRAVIEAALARARLRAKLRPT